MNYEEEEQKALEYLQWFDEPPSDLSSLSSDDDSDDESKSTDIATSLSSRSQTPNSSRSHTPNPSLLSQTVPLLRSSTPISFQSAQSSTAAYLGSLNDETISGFGNIVDNLLASRDSISLDLPVGLAEDAINLHF